MAYKKCRDWMAVKYTDATCPYCNHRYEYCGGLVGGNVIRCLDPKCQRRFKLGPEE